MLSFYETLKNDKYNFYNNYDHKSSEYDKRFIKL